MIHILGKEITKFHAIIWPSLLLSIGYPPPLKLIVHNFWTNQGVKMSKRLNNVVNPFEIINKYGLTSVRLYMLSQGPLDQDEDFSEELLVITFNSIYVMKLCNLINRIYSKNFMKNLVLVIEPLILDKDHENICNKIEDCFKKSLNHLLEFKFNLSFIETIDIVNQMNQFFSQNKIYLLNGLEKMKAIYLVYESLRLTSILLKPFLPDFKEKLSLITGPQSEELSFRRELKAPIVINSNKLNEIFENKLQIPNKLEI